MVMLWSQHGSSMGIAWNTVGMLWEYSGSAMGTLWKYYGKTMGILRKLTLGRNIMDILRQYVVVIIMMGML